MAEARTDTDVMAPLDLSHLCDGERMNFPIGTEVATIKVILNGVYLAEGMDFLLHRDHGRNVISLRKTPAPGDQLIVLRVPASPKPHRPEPDPRLTWRVDIPYDQLPRLVKDNISPEQWIEAQRAVILEGGTIPEETDYIDLKNGQIHRHTIGETASGPLLPVHDLAGARGKDSTQYHTTPPGAHDLP
jgi:hypothetical protein